MNSAARGLESYIQANSAQRVLEALGGSDEESRNDLFNDYLNSNSLGRTNDFKNLIMEEDFRPQFLPDPVDDIVEGSYKEDDNFD